MGRHQGRTVSVEVARLDPRTKKVGAVGSAHDPARPADPSRHVTLSSRSAGSAANAYSRRTRGAARELTGSSLLVGRHATASSNQSA